VRDHALRETARQAYWRLTPEECRLFAVALLAMKDEGLPLVAPEDFSVRHGSMIMGHPVPGTDLVICYVPEGDRFSVVNIVRRSR
jgi:hypothetical protein